MVSRVVLALQASELNVKVVVSILRSIVKDNRARESRLSPVFIAGRSSAHTKAKLDGSQISSAYPASWPTSQKTANGNRSDSGTLLI